MQSDARSWRYEISIWNFEGDVVEKFWSVTDDERDEIEERYRGEPYTIVIDREWEEAEGENTCR